MLKQIRLWRDNMQAFLRAKGGNIAMMFGLSLIPITIAAGAGVDLARAMAVKSSMSDALDSAALAIGATPNITQSAAQSLAQQYFNANFKPDSPGDSVPPITVTVSGQSVVISASDNMPTTVLKAAGQFLHSSALQSINVVSSTTVVWGQTKLWVSLVLDNTGSMCEPDSNPCPGDTSANIKINALKTATHNLLTTLQNASGTPGDVMVAIVPFGKDVNVGTANVSATWIDWTNWNTAYPGTAPAATVGPGDSCPISASYNQCLTQPGGALGADGVTMTTTSTVPSTGTYTGYICPGSLKSSSSGQAGHYYNGCYTSVSKGTTTTVSSGSSATCSGYHNCSCTGNGSSKQCKATNYNHPWVLNPTSTWRGCVMDRGTVAAPGTTAGNDETNTTPTTADSTTLFPAENDDSCTVAAVTPMTSPKPSSAGAMSTMFTSLNTQVDAMVANGGTNQTVGLAHGMQMLVSGTPYSAPTLPSGTTRYIILLSDGLNTMDRWYGTGSAQSTSVDTRMAATCTNAKAQGFIIYTIFVDLNGTQGNSTVLQNCATDTSHYFDLTTVGSIITTFNNIAQKITSLRVAG